MKRGLCLLFLLLLVSSAFAQERVLRIRQFSGLANVFADNKTDSTSAVRAINVDMGRFPGSIAKRYGYDSVGTKSGTDSVTGFFSATWEDGSSQLVAATDDSAKPYGGLYLLSKWSTNLNGGTKIWDYWSAQRPTDFMMYNDRLYAVNGLQKGVIYERIGDTNIIRSFPLQAPGEPLVSPSDSGSLTGEYRYVFLGTMYPTTNRSADMGYVSGPYRVTNGGFVLRWFAGMQADSIGTPDSTIIKIYRTKANPGRLDELDSAYYTGLQWKESLGVATSVAIFDTIRDNQLTSAIPLMDKNYQGVDSSRSVKSGYRLGSPTFVLDSFDVYTHVKDSAKLRGVFYGQPYTDLASPGDSARFKQMNVAVAYTTSLYDSLLNVESDTGRSLFVYDKRYDSSLIRVRIGLPKIADSLKKLHYRLYRSHLMWMTRDTSVLVWSGTGIGPFSGKLMAEAMAKKRSDYYAVQDKSNSQLWRVYQRAKVNDTILLGPYHMVAQIPAESTKYTDSLRYDSLILNPVYYRETPPPLMRGLFSYSGKVFGISGSRLYWSTPDTGSTWNAFNFVSISAGDGEEINIAYPTRNAIRVLKASSSYNLYRDDGGSWVLTEVSSKTGCISPGSYQRGIGGHYYLTSFGVVAENEGQFLERTQATALTSAMLNNFDKLPITTKRNSHSAYVDQTYLLSIGDTTYVYFEKSKSWATWTNFKVGYATMFRGTSSVGFVPADTMYFFQPGGKILYRYKSSETDAGSDIIWQWKTPLLLLDENFKTLRGFGTYTRCDSSGITTALPAVIFNQENDSLGNAILSSDMSLRYDQVGAPRFAYGFGFYIMPYHLLDVNNAIDGLDIYYTVDGRFRRK